MAAPDVPLIDPHFHLWNLDENYYPWLSDEVGPAAWGSCEGLLSNYLIDDYLRDAEGQELVKSVHLDVGWDPRDPVGETRWLQRIADQRGFPHGIVGYADLTSPEVEAVLDGHMEHANFRGVRQSMNYHPEPAKTYLSRPEVSRTAEWRRGFRQLRKRELSFDLQLYYPQAEEFFELAAEHSDVPIIVNHAGMQVDGPEHFEAWRAGMAVLAQAPNVACKISGLGMGEHDWTTESIRPCVESALELFGVERCMFASNFPVDKLFSGYAEIFGAFREITREYSRDERTALFHDNAARYYRL
ncbi:amidohydrolase family protein [Salinifilum ghardaiensis]